eukprot:757501-Hanusia_phi.AAC.1
MACHKFWSGEDWLPASRLTGRNRRLILASSDTTDVTTRPAPDLIIQRLKASSRVMMVTVPELPAPDLVMMP